jgi:hypothetical protein
MIFIWTGQGGWIPGSLILCLCVTTAIDRWLLAPSGIGFTLPIAVAGLFCVGLGLHARCSPARLVRNSATGCELFMRPKHSAYWIRAEYWGLLYLGLAVWLQSILPGGAAR